MCVCVYIDCKLVTQLEKTSGSMRQQKLNTNVQQYSLRIMI